MGFNGIRVQLGFNWLFQFRFWIPGLSFSWWRNRVWNGYSAASKIREELQRFGTCATGDFVKANGLQEGDVIVIYSNIKSDKYILERYERYSYADRQLIASDPDSTGNWTLEYTKLKARIELLQRNHRHYMGEDLDSLTLKEIQNLEQQLDTALKHIRARKNQLIFESISDLQKKCQRYEMPLRFKYLEKEIAYAVGSEENRRLLIPFLGMIAGSLCIKHLGTTLIHQCHSGSDQDAVKITVTGSSVNGGSTSKTLSLRSSGRRDMHIGSFAV